MDTLEACFAAVGEKIMRQRIVCLFSGWWREAPMFQDDFLAVAPAASTMNRWVDRRPLFLVAPTEQTMS